MGWVAKGGTAKRGLTGHEVPEPERYANRLITRQANNQCMWHSLTPAKTWLVCRRSSLRWSHLQHSSSPRAAHITSKKGGRKK